MPEKNGTTASIAASVGGYKQLGRFVEARDELRILVGLPPLGRMYAPQLYELSEARYKAKKKQKNREREESV